MVSFSKIATFAGVVGLSIAGHDGHFSHGHPSATVDRSDSPVSKPFEADKADPTHAFSHVNFKRGDLGVYECKGRNWKGPCTWTKADGGACHNWIYGSGGSMGPDRGLVCRIYKASNCNDGGKYLDGFQLPGFPNYLTNLWLVPNGMSNGPASYKCKKA